MSAGWILGPGLASRVAAIPGPRLATPAEHLQACDYPLRESDGTWTFRFLPSWPTAIYVALDRHHGCLYTGIVQRGTTEHPDVNAVRDRAREHYRDNQPPRPATPGTTFGSSPSNTGPHAPTSRHGKPACAGRRHPRRPARAHCCARPSTARPARRAVGPADPVSVKLWPVSQRRAQAGGMLVGTPMPDGIRSCVRASSPRSARTGFQRSPRLGPRWRVLACDSSEWAPSADGAGRRSWPPRGRRRTPPGGCPHHLNLIADAFAEESG